MRSPGSGPLGALLMLAPLIAVPILAVVGIPQFAPGNLLGTNNSDRRDSTRERRTAEETGYGDDATADDPDDLFGPLDKPSIGKGRFKDPLNPRGSRGRGRSSDRSSESADEESPFDGADNSLPGDNGSDLEVDAPEQDPGGDRIADNESIDSYGNDTLGQRPGRGQRRPEPDDEAAPFDAGDNPFEPSAPGGASRPNGKRRPSPPAHPNDAPLFESRTDEESVPPDDRGLEQESTQPRGPAKRPRVVPPKAPEESPDEPLNPADEQAGTDTESSQVNELTWQVAAKRLRLLGVGKSKQHFTYLEDRDRFIFSCTATHRGDSTKTKSFQAEAEEPLLAVRQVLENLQTWQDSNTKPRSSTRTGQRASL